MKLLIEPRLYSKPKIRITVSQHETKVKVPAQLDGMFKDRVAAFAMQVTAACEVAPGAKTMRGTIGLDETTGKMSVVMAQDSPRTDIQVTVTEA